jgi:hypothetical protein
VPLFLETHAFMRYGGTGVPFVQVSAPCSALSFIGDVLVVDDKAMELVQVNFSSSQATSCHS